MSQRRSYLSGFLQGESTDSPSLSSENNRETRSPSPDLLDGLPPSTQPDRRNMDAIKNMLLRRYIEDISSVDDMERPKKKKKQISPTQPGRGIKKVVDLFHDLPDLLVKARKHRMSIAHNVEGVRNANSDEFAGLTEQEIKMEKANRYRCYRAMILLDKLIPDFEKKSNTAESVYSFCSPLQEGATDARSDDTGRLKVAVAEWINSRIASGPRLSPKGKEERGLSHDMTGRLLCPINYDWDNPDICAKLRNAAAGYNFTDNFFLRCLYENEEGEPDYPEDGFLKGPLLVRAYRHIFTSPSSATNEDVSESDLTSRRRDIASTLGLNGQVTPRSIAYTATQLLFSLNSARDWRKEHAGFHYPSFYNFVVDLLEYDDNTDEASKADIDALLKWWNTKIFPTTVRNGGEGTSHDALQSSMERIMEARQRRIRG